MEEGTQLFLTSFSETQHWEDSLAEAAAIVSQKYKVKLQKVYNNLDSIVPSEEELIESGLPRDYDAWRTQDPYSGDEDYERESERVYLNFDLGRFLASDYASDFDYKDVSENPEKYDIDDKTYPASYIISSLAGYLESQSEKDFDLEEIAKQLFNEQVAEALQKAGYTLQLDLKEEIDMGDRIDAVEQAIELFEAYTKKPRATSKEVILKEIAEKVSTNYAAIPTVWLVEQMEKKLAEKDS